MTKPSKTKIAANRWGIMIKRMTFMLLAAIPALFMVFSPAQARERYGVIIANGEYQNVRPLAYARNDFTAAKHLFKDVLGIPERNLILMSKDVTKSSMDMLFGQKGLPVKYAGLYRRIKARDADVYVYLILHGMPAKMPDGSIGAFFLLKDSNPQPYALAATAYSRKTLFDQLRRIRAARFPQGRVTVIMESCFSGKSDGLNAPAGGLVEGVSAPGFAPPQLENPESFRIISAARADQYAVWDRRFHQSVFTMSLVMGMYGEADADHDGKIRAEELKAYLEKAVAKAARRNKGFEQQPEMTGFQPRTVLARLDGIRSQWNRVDQWRKEVRALEQQRKAVSEGADDAGEDAAYRQTVIKGTMEAYEAYLKKYPYSRHAKTIKKLLDGRIDGLAWERAKRENTISAYNNYLIVNPGGLYVRQARERIKELEDRASRERQREAEKRQNPPRPPAPQPAPPASAAPAAPEPVPETVRPSFDCRKARHSYEQAICQNARLAALDLRMSQLYFLVKSRSSRATGRILRGEQRTWLKYTRNPCGWDVECLRQAYEMRINQLLEWENRE